LKGGLIKTYHSIDIIPYPASASQISEAIANGGRNTWDYWHLIPNKRPVVGPPEVKSQIIDLPGGNGFIDLSELITGDVIYGQRQGSWQFIAHPDYTDPQPWQWKYQDIMQYLHGRQHMVILEDDPFYYYIGRLKVNQWDSGPNWSQVTIDYTLQPFKKEIIDSTEPWKWDPFSFVNGIIRSYSGITLNNETKTITIRTGAETLIPTFIVNSGDTIWVTFNGVEYPLSNDSNTFNAIKFKNGDNVLSVRGTGHLTISFRGGWL